MLIEWWCLSISCVLKAPCVFIHSCTCVYVCLYWQVWGVVGLRGVSNKGCLQGVTKYMWQYHWRLVKIQSSNLLTLANGFSGKWLHVCSTRNSCLSYYWYSDYFYFCGSKQAPHQNNWPYSELNKQDIHRQPTLSCPLTCIHTNMFINV